MVDRIARVKPAQVKLVQKDLGLELVNQKVMAGSTVVLVSSQIEMSAKAIEQAIAIVAGQRGLG